MPEKWPEYWRNLHRQQQLVCANMAFVFRCVLATLQEGASIRNAFGAFWGYRRLSLSVRHCQFAIVSSSFCQFVTVSSSLLQCNRTMHATLVNRPYFLLGLMTKRVFQLGPKSHCLNLVVMIKKVYFLGIMNGHVFSLKFSMRDFSDWHVTFILCILCVYSYSHLIVAWLWGRQKWY